MEGKDKAWNIEDLLDEATLAKIEEDILRTGKVTTIGGFDFKCTCFAYPEQYDAFLDGQYVAYVRERHGRLTVNPVIEGNIDWNRLIYEELDGGKGLIFEKREEKLALIAKKIEIFLERNNVKCPK